MYANEQLEVLTANGEPTGLVKARDAVHRDGDWHRAFHLWLMLPDRSVLVQRRSTSKDLAGGLIDVSVAGHIAAGETWREAVRESQEEIGLPLDPDSLTFFFRERSERFYPDGRCDREFHEVYAALLDERVASTLRPNPSELSALYWVPLAALLKLVRDGHGAEVVGIGPTGEPIHELLGEADLIQPGRRGVERALRALERLDAQRSAHGVG
jgi:isopentenyldiphosphate isomerase